MRHVADLIGFFGDDMVRHLMDCSRPGWDLM